MEKSSFVLACCLTALMAGSTSLATAAQIDDEVTKQATIFTPNLSATPYQFVKEILRSHPAIKAARQRVQSAKVTARGLDGAIYNPEAELRYESDRVDSDNSDFRLEIRQAIDVFDKRGAQTALGEAEHERAVTQLAAAQKHVAVEVLQALVDVLMSAEEARLTAQQLSLVDEFVKAEEKRLEAGDAGRVAVDLAQLAHAEANARSVTAELERRDAEQRLRVASRLQPRLWPSLPGHLPELSEDLLVEALIDELPEVRLASNATLLADRTVTVLDRMRRPDPKFGSEFEYSEEDGLTTILTLGIDLPVRNTYIYRVEAALNRKTAAEFDAMDTRVRAAMAADAAARNYRASAEAWRAWEAGTLTSVTEGLERLDRQRLAGDISATNFLLQLKQRLDTRLAGVRLLQHAWEDWVTWLEATGRWEAWLVDDHRQRGAQAK